MIYSERLSPELVTIDRIDATTAKENGAHIFAPFSSKGCLLHKTALLNPTAPRQSP